MAVEVVQGENGCSGPRSPAFIFHIEVHPSIELANKDGCIAAQLVDYPW